MLAGRLPWQGNGLADPLAEGIHKDTDGPDQASDSVASLTFRAVTLPLRTSLRRPLGLDTALTSSRLLPPRQGHECSGRRCHGRHHPSCQRAPAALLGLHNTGIPWKDSRPCGHLRRRCSSRASWSPTRRVGSGGGCTARGKGVLCLGLGLVRMAPQVRGGIRSILRTHPSDTSLIPRATVDVWR